MFIQAYSQPTHATRNNLGGARHQQQQASTLHPDVQRAIATLQTHGVIPAPNRKSSAPKHPTAYRQVPSLSRTPADAAQSPAAWQRIERATVFMVNPQICPIPVPLRAETGFITQPSGRPAKHYVADGYFLNGKQVACNVVPHKDTGHPFVVWADGVNKTDIKVQG